MRLISIKFGVVICSKLVPTIQVSDQNFVCMSHLMRDTCPPTSLSLT